MSEQPAALEIWQRADISPRDLAALKRHAREMSEALARINILVAEEIQLGVVTSKSVVWKIEKIAREAICE